MTIDRDKDYYARARDGCIGSPWIRQGDRLQIPRGGYLDGDYKGSRGGFLKNKKQVL